MEGAMPPGAMSASRGEEYASGGCAEELPMLVVPPGRMVGFGIIVSLSMVALALVHFTLKLLQDCARRPTQWPYNYIFGASSASPPPKSLLGRIQALFLPVSKKDGTEMPLFLVAKVEGQGFSNFLVLAGLEAIISITSLANAHLEGDLAFQNDPGQAVIDISWGLAITNFVLLASFVAHYRRLKGHKRLFCLFNKKGQLFTSSLDRAISDALEQTVVQKKKITESVMRMMELFTWGSLCVSTLQVYVGATISASQVAAAGDTTRRLAVLINVIQVASILLAKLYSLYDWYDVYRVHTESKNHQIVRSSVVGVVGPDGPGTATTDGPGTTTDQV